MSGMKEFCKRAQMHKDARKNARNNAADAPPSCKLLLNKHAACHVSSPAHHENFWVDCLDHETFDIGSNLEARIGRLNLMAQGLCDTSIMWVTCKPSPPHHENRQWVVSTMELHDMSPRHCSDGKKGHQFTLWAK